MGEFFPLQEERTIDTDPIQTQPNPKLTPNRVGGVFWAVGRGGPKSV